MGNTFGSAQLAQVCCQAVLANYNARTEFDEADVYKRQSYSSGSNEKADWPKNFRFEGDLFVTDKNGDIIEESTTRLNDSESVNFEPGDVIWMPLYADNQIVWDSTVVDGTDDKEAATNVKLNATITVAHNDTWTEDDYAAKKDILASNQYAVKSGNQYIIRSVDITNKTLPTAYAGSCLLYTSRCV